MAILSKWCKLENVEPQNSLKVSFLNIWGLCSSNFVKCEFFLVSNSPDILALCETNLYDSIDSGNFSKTLSSFNPKRFYYSYAWSCSLWERRTSFCRGLISRKLCRLLLVFDWLYFTQCVTSFSSIDCLFCHYAGFLNLFHII